MIPRAPSPPRIAGTACSIALVTSGAAELPEACLILKPFQRAGLWLAVITTPAAAPRSSTACDSAGVGAAVEARATVMPLAANTSAVAFAKASERKRVS